MHLNIILCAFLAAFGLQGTMFAQERSEAQSETPAVSAPTQAASAAKRPLSIEYRRQRAMANLPLGRIKRPANYDEATLEEKAYIDSVISGPRTTLSGDLAVWMLSPTMADLAQKAVGYARFNSTVPAKLNELTVLIIACTWTAQAEWRAHRPAALRAGLSPEIVESIRLGKRPANMAPDVEAIYNFCTELLNTRQVTDATLQAARAALGSESRLVDLIATLGTYQFVAITMTVDQTPLPAGVQPDLPPLDSAH